MAFIGQLLSALVAIPKILDYVERFAAAVTLWYIQRQNTQTLAEISDAAAFAARAQTKEDRYEASVKWMRAFSRPRHSR